MFFGNYLIIFIYLHSTVWFQETKIIILCKLLYLQVTILNTNNLPIVIWYQVFYRIHIF